MIIARWLVELHGRDEYESEEGSAERWALEDARAEKLFSDWVQRAPDLDLGDNYRILVFSDND